MLILLPTITNNYGWLSIPVDSHRLQMVIYSHWFIQTLVLLIQKWKHAKDKRLSHAPIAAWAVHIIKVAESRRVIEHEARCNLWEVKVGVRVRIRYNHSPLAGGVGAANMGRFEARHTCWISAGVLQQWRGSEAGHFEARNASVKCVVWGKRSIFVTLDRDSECPQAKTVRNREGGDHFNSTGWKTITCHYSADTGGSSCHHCLHNDNI
jgi:hypothetical protein